MPDKMETPTAKEYANLVRLLHQRYQDLGDTLARQAAWALEDAKQRAQEAKHVIEMYLATFAHWHVNRGDGTDACKACGLDLRDKIHGTTSYEAAKARSAK